MKRLLLFALFFYGNFCFAQKSTRLLQKKIKTSIVGFGGDIGIYVKNLRTGKTISINADSIFPTASIVKVPILIGVSHKLQSKELSLDSLFIYKDSLLYKGEDILGSFKNDETVSLKKILMLMLTTSDNTASLWLQSIAGGGTRVNELLDSLGFSATRINSRTPGREINRAQFGWGQTTPREAGILFESIYNKKFFSAEASEKMLRMLGRNFWDAEALSQVPPTIEVFSKNGAVNASRSEVLLVNAPRNPYLFCIFTKNNKDQRWDNENEAWVLTRKISKLLWETFGKK